MSAHSKGTSSDLGAIVEAQVRQMITKVALAVCTKKRCERHKQWLKIQQQELAFERHIKAGDEEVG
jgi:COMPASS component SPP1